MANFFISGRFHIIKSAFFQYDKIPRFEYLWKVRNENYPKVSRIASNFNTGWVIAIREAICILLSNFRKLLNVQSALYNKRLLDHNAIGNIMDTCGVIAQSDVFVFVCGL